jgi:hypothetical protein
MSVLVTKNGDTTRSFETSMLASMIHLWVTIHGISFPVMSALSRCGHRFN